MKKVVIIEDVSPHHLERLANEIIQREYALDHGLTEVKYHTYYDNSRTLVFSMVLIFSGC